MVLWKRPVVEWGDPDLLDLVQILLMDGVLELERHIVRVADLHRPRASALQHTRRTRRQPRTTARYQPRIPTQHPRSLP